ncbi:YggS family pyridoxal phosphate-dependent enzyme [Nitrincola iocasae]|uniref:Pyridoxal phosphate homeostasis protein n=1 Tax=Nitrincola iocasae TaxID=2614693 RepID=A0A5J6LHV6_9GAMM|nr:YggS family pyridoxal phosphate-dependent enzyme [Nitrincola iocasae]QEW08078.1 YggS family pyridoxal phosphate-dependent enzyme [Nitrincola iocasae]
MSIIAEKTTQVVSEINQACLATGRHPSEVALLAVSKTRSANEVREAYQQGLTRFGENYLQEALDKIQELDDLPLEWHFIGPVQSNKTRQIAEAFDWVHSVDRLKIARRLSEQRPTDLPDLNVCLQVNIDDESSKSGCSPDEALELARAIAALPHICLRGLMAIPAASDDETVQRLAFAKVRELAERIRANGLAMDTLSMGMSGDLAAAIAEGSTLVRIGTALFGPRAAKG